MRLTTTTALLALLAAACGDDGATTSRGEGGGRVCVPGAQSACACPGGAEGVQVCNSAGTLLLACNCGSPATSSASSTGGADTTGSGAGGSTTSSAEGGGSTTSAQGGAGGETSAQGGGTTTGGGGEDPGATSWLLGVGDASYEQHVDAIASRRDGGVVVAIRGRGTFDVGSETFSSPNGFSAALVQIDAAGTVESLSTVSSSGDDSYVTALVPLDDGGFSAVGHFCAPTDLGDGTVVLNDGCDAFIASYDATGALASTKIVGGPGVQVFITAAGLEGDLVVVGVGESLDLGRGPVPSTSGVVLARLTAAGDVVWTRGFESENINSSAHPVGLAIDPVGGIAFGGVLEAGGADFGNGFLVGPSERGLYFARFDGAGELIDARAYLCEAPNPSRVSVGPDGSVALAGYYLGLCENLSPSESSDEYFALVSPPVGQPWSRSLPSGSYATPFVSTAGLMLVGQCSGPVDFGGGVTQPNGDDIDLFVTRYDPSGALLNVDRYGPAGGAAAHVDLGAYGELAIGGATCVDIDLGFGAATHQGSCDAWVARIDDP